VKRATHKAAMDALAALELELMVELTKYDPGGTPEERKKWANAYYRWNDVREASEMVRKVRRN